MKALGIERGVPPLATAQGLLAPDLDELGKMQINYVAAVTKIAVPLPPPPPKGAGEIEKLLLRVADSVAFGEPASRTAPRSSSPRPKASWRGHELAGTATSRALRRGVRSASPGAI